MLFAVIVLSLVFGAIGGAAGSFAMEHLYNRATERRLAETVFKRCVVCGTVAVMSDEHGDARCGEHAP